MAGSMVDKDNLLFSSSPKKLLFSGMCHSWRFCGISGNLLCVFDDLQLDELYRGFESWLLRQIQKAPSGAFWICGVWRIRFGPSGSTSQRATLEQNVAAQRRRPRRGRAL